LYQRLKKINLLKRQFKRTGYLSFFILFVLSQALPLQVSAEEEVELQSPELILPENLSNKVVDETLTELSSFQAWLGGYVSLVGRKLDELITNEADFDEANGSKLELTLPYTVHANTQQNFSPRLNAKVDLPHTNQKWKLFVNSFNEDKEKRTVSTKVDQGNTQTQLGVQIQLKKTLDLLNLLDFGFSAKGFGLPAVYTRYKSIYYQKLTPDWNRRWFGKLFWESDLGVGLQLALRHDRAIHMESLLFRAETQANWWDKGQYWDLYHDFILFHPISVDRSAIYFLGWNWNTQNKGLHLSRFSFGNKLRQRLYKKWLYFDVKPLITFTEDSHFEEPDPSITLQIEMQFYQSSR